MASFAPFHPKLLPKDAPSTPELEESTPPQAASCSQIPSSQGKHDPYQEVSDHSGHL